MKRKKLRRYALSAPFFAVGFVGLLIPILQGFLFLGIGILIIASENPRVKYWVEKRIEPYPRINRIFKKYIAEYLER